MQKVNSGTEHHGVPSAETKPTPELSAAPSDTLAEALLADMDERDRLHRLSDFELIRETLKDSVADDLRVGEMKERLYPDWYNEPEPPEMPKEPRYVSVALRLGVAHEVVAFSECHCGERIATANTVAEDEDYRPCLWCALNAALFRATKQDMYQHEPVTSEQKG